jgi:nucleoside-diphosphate-sugar epimerase
MNANAFSSRSSTIMSARVLVLGAAGRLHTAAQALRDAGWTVASLVRPGNAARAPADLVLAKEIGRGRLTYPGPLDLLHEWAYLPDLASTLPRLAAIRETLPSFASFGFPGHAVTGREFTSAIAAATGRKLQVDHMTWWLIHALRPIVPLSRELSEIAYLWNQPHRIDGGKLEAAIGDIPRTPLDVAVARALEDLGAVA